ncbi:MAG TPA: RluA family pseudouridine synthase [Roseimicrobium sp.]|nr:RluA family pseudouridine synthase [Roseimicrobium sp.]
MSTNRSESFVIELSLPQERLDRFLCERYAAVSRGTIQRLIESGDIQVNGKTVKPTHHPKCGDKIDVHWPDARPAEAEPQEMPLEILFEDVHLLILNKPPGLVVHPAAGHADRTLVNALLHHCKGQLSGIGGVARPGIVHRLDKDTSGCLVVAKDDETHLALSKQFASRDVEKIYHAILCGELSRSSGDIKASIARHPSHRKRMAVTDGGGRPAWTTYRRLELLKAATLVEALLHTGRTHQIRVHFQHLGFPIVGDDTYGSRQNARLKEITGYAAARQMLHASKLSIHHPVTGKTLTCEAPWPEDFREALTALGSKK